MSDTLYTSQTPAVQGSDGAPGITTSTTIQVAASRSCTGIQFYATATPSGTYTVAIWQVTGSDAGAGGTGTLLASKAVASGTITGNAYNEVSFDTPVALSTGVLYRCGVHNGSLYVATNSFFASPLTNGDITAPANGSDPLSNGWALAQGAFIIDAALQYPRQVGTSASYFVGPALAPAGGAAVNVDATKAITVGVAGTQAVSRPVSGAVAETVSVAGAQAVSRPVSGTVTETATITGAVAVDRPVAGAVTTTVGVTGAAAVTPGAAGAVTETISIAGTMSVIHNLQGSVTLGLSVAGTLEPNPPPAVAQGNWSSLLTIMDYNAEQAYWEDTRTPVDCPVHKGPLEPGREPGTLHCVFGGDLWDEFGQPVYVW